MVWIGYATVYIKGSSNLRLWDIKGIKKKEKNPNNHEANSVIILVSSYAFVLIIS